MKHWLLFLGITFLAACQPDSPTRPDITDTDPVSDDSRDIRTGYVWGPTGEAIKVTYEVRDGLAVREWDIVLGPADSIPSTPEQLKRGAGPRFGVYVDDNGTNRWPNGTVPYIIAADLPNPQRVLDAIGHVTANAPGFTFTRLTESQAQGKDAIRFVRDTAACQSHIGKFGGIQQIWLADGCTMGIVVHEIGHALGMMHEHARCDREAYVRIEWNNIHPQNFQNFDIRCWPYTDFGSYTEGSIMHYGPYDGALNTAKPTITSLRNRASEMGQRHRLHESDVSTLSWLYPARTQVHRWYNPNWAGGDHLYTLDPNEGWAHGYTREHRDYFRLTSATGEHYATLYRCLANNHHYLSRSSTCEVGVAAEGQIGRVAKWQMGGTVPLYRLRHPHTGDRLATIYSSERAAVLNAGWVDEGVLGYVWRGS